jgi:hypothetical protein
MSASAVSETSAWPVGNEQCGDDGFPPSAQQEGPETAQAESPDIQSQQCPVITHKVHTPTPWERAINSIYESDYTGDAIEFELILKDTPELLSHVDGGFGLIHFLFDSSSGPWENGTAAYLSLGGDISLKTCDYLTSLGGGVGCGLCVVGGRSVLHVAATKLGKRTDIFETLCSRYPGLEKVADLNGIFPRALLGYHDTAMTEFKAVLARNPVKIIDLRELPSGRNNRLGRCSIVQRLY